MIGRILIAVVAAVAVSAGSFAAPLEAQQTGAAGQDTTRQLPSLLPIQIHPFIPIQEPVMGGVQQGQALRLHLPMQIRPLGLDLGNIGIEVPPAGTESSLPDTQEPPVNVMLRFQLIEANTANFARDPAIAAVDSVLRDLFRFSAYRLLSQAVVVATHGTSTVQLLSGGGQTYQLDVGVAEIDGRAGATAQSPRTPSSTKVQVVLSTYPMASLLQSDTTTAGQGTMTAEEARARMAAMSALSVRTEQAMRTTRHVLLRTTVTVTNGHTVVLGSTQPGGSGSALILVVRPEVR